MDLRDEAGRVTYMESTSESLGQRNTTYKMMYYKPFSEIGRLQCSYALSRGDGSKGKGSCEGRFAHVERGLLPVWAVERGWHKGIRQDIRGKSATDPAACGEPVDSQLSIAEKGRLLNRAEIANGGSRLVEKTALLCCEGAAECCVDGRTDLMTRDIQVVGNRGDRLWGSEWELADSSHYSQPVKYARGWHTGGGIACEGDADDSASSLSIEDRLKREGDKL